MYQALLLIAKDFLIPLGLMFWQWKGKYRDRTFPLLMIVLTGAYVGFIYLAADWGIYGYYFRYILAGLFLLITGALLRRINPLPGYVRKRPRESFGQWVIIIFVVFFVALDAWAIWGLTAHVPAVSLAFPLKHGTFCVLEGGDSPVINRAHHALPPVPEKYAVDLIKLNRAGRRAEALFPDAPADFAIFGESVYSPVNGRVIATVDSFPDVPAPAVVQNDTAALGNRVVIAFENYEVVLAQLKQGSIRVATGDTVIAGQLLAAVGSSGDVAEPHLHIHVTMPATDSYVQKYWPRAGVPIEFDGKFLAKNDRLVIP